MGVKKRRAKPESGHAGWDGVTVWIYEGCKLIAQRLGVLEREWQARVQTIADLRASVSSQSERIDRLSTRVNQHAKHYDELIEWVELKLEHALDDSAPAPPAVPETDLGAQPQHRDDGGARQVGDPLDG